MMDSLPAPLMDQNGFRATPLSTPAIPRVGSDVISKEIGALTNYLGISVDSTTRNVLTLLLQLGTDADTSG